MSVIHSTTNSLLLETIPQTKCVRRENAIDEHKYLTLKKLLAVFYEKLHEFEDALQKKNR